MATDRQIEANQRNAAKSTGPKSDEGKARSRANALKHGLAGEGVVVAGVDDAAFADRMRSWAKDYRPEGEAGGWAMERLVAASFRIEACERALGGVIASKSERASVAWDEDRRLDAAAVASKLARDPVLGAARLEATWHGCGLMVELWTRLGEALEANGDWSEPQLALALDLMAVPAALRDGPSDLDASEGTDRLIHRREYVADRIAWLESRREDLIHIDTLDRDRAEAGHVAILSPEAKAVLRYERDAWRRYREARADLRTPSPAPLPVPAPPPPPARPEAPRPRAVTPEEQVGIDMRDRWMGAMNSPSYVDIAATPDPSAPRHRCGPESGRSPEGSTSGGTGGSPTSVGARTGCALAEPVPPTDAEAGFDGISPSVGWHWLRQSSSGDATGCALAELVPPTDAEARIGGISPSVGWHWLGQCSWGAATGFGTGGASATRRSGRGVRARRGRLRSFVCRIDHIEAGAGTMGWVKSGQAP